MRRPLTIMNILLAATIACPATSEAAKIVVDAGHGGSDPGAVGVNGLYEKTVNLDIAEKLKDLLAARGYEVAMTRSDDTFISLKDRVEITNAQDADLFVSIHANSYSNPGTRGAMVLYYDSAYPQEDYPASTEMSALTPQSRAFAQQMLDTFVSTMGVENRGLVPSAVYVVRMGKTPSILIETAFLTNGQDASMLADSGVRTRMAQAIESGIEAYLPPDDASAVFTDTRTHWAKDAILRLRTQGIVDGVGRQFQPDRELTRAEWVTLLDRVFDLSKVQPSSAGACSAVAGAVYGSGCQGAAPASFKDAPAGHWASAALNKAVRAGVLDGYEDGTLRPDRPVTRAEVAAMFQRLALPQATASAASSQPQPFKDVPASSWSAASIYSLKQAGWIDGVTADRYMPDRRMTRAESAALLDRYVRSKGGAVSASAGSRKEP